MEAIRDNAQAFHQRVQVRSGAADLAIGSRRNRARQATGRPSQSTIQVIIAGATGNNTIIITIDRANRTIRKAHMNFRTPFFFKCFCFAASALLSAHAFADIYKCTDGAGDVSYVQSPTDSNCVLLDGSTGTTDTTIVAPAAVYPETVEHPVAVKKAVDERDRDVGRDNRPDVVEPIDRRDPVIDRNTPITPNRPIGRRR